MMVLATVFMGCAAVWMQLIWTAPEMNDAGRIIGPSMRDLAREQRRGRRRG